MVWREKPWAPRWDPKGRRRGTSETQQEITPQQAQLLEGIYIEEGIGVKEKGEEKSNDMLNGRKNIISLFLDISEASHVSSKLVMQWQPLVQITLSIFAQCS